MTAYRRRCSAGASCCGTCNDHAAVVLVLLGTGAAAVDDHTDACPPLLSAAACYGSADAALVLVRAKVDAQNAANPRP